MRKGDENSNTENPTLKPKILEWVTLSLLIVLMFLVGHLLSSPISIDLPVYNAFPELLLTLTALWLLSGFWVWFRIMPSQSGIDWPKLIKELCFPLIMLILVSLPLIHGFAWFQLQAEPKQIMNAQIIALPTQYSSKSCRQWTLLLQNEAQTTVCKTGPDLKWQPGQNLTVEVRRLSWAYEIHYLNH